ncbi:aminoglycoside phosphotransferase [Paenibacillus nanensis]|uniref:Aminoglycoside phosphotransferase n=1 Tax=Paenibacillus nanensis TaxID=393251 RepID=A0A3A1UMY8_9BACL|nr:phosphotransferase [Paenibacillus nanensis]RIX48760.1 aminoglycoside phosphotransferase [Paenibacillus nanensis]
MHKRLPALRSVLEPSGLSLFLAPFYGVGEWKECVFWLHGLNDTYRVRTTEGLFILRVCRTELREEDAAYETELLMGLNKALGDGATGVSEAVSRIDGGLYTMLEAPEGHRAAILFRYAEGQENTLHDEASCFVFGKSAAELHSAMDRVQTRSINRFTLDTSFLIDQPAAKIIEYIGAGHCAAPFLRQFAETLKERIAAAAAKGLDWGLCHGDMHGNNNAFQRDNGFIHYDFEWAAPGWRAYDLAQVRIRKRQPREEDRERLWQAVMSGYRSVRPFSAQDEEMIDTFVWVRRLWVMGLDVLFIPSTSGALDYGEEWLQSFVDEFRSARLE